MLNALLVHPHPQPLADLVLQAEQAAGVNDDTEHENECIDARAELTPSN